jgi:cellulose synthase/poly-beta-1,6-N-acetylglucosamine synthase-like glycosyltransferase
VPAYGESAVIGDTIRSLCVMDYPRDRLEILVLLERRDLQTRQAVAAVNPPEHVRVVLLPPGKPQTKPRSINLGLMLARGDHLVIFDAEDRPEPDQLRKVAAQFRAGGPQLAVVQARLNFYNRRQTLLTCLFSLEYSFQWDLMYRGVSRLRLPLPLGGTSNHFRTELLRKVGGWDAWNVTEDADLGMRFAAAGYRLELNDSITWEEAPAAHGAWMRQRTRWLKGHLLTFTVHTRNPFRSVRRFGIWGMVGLTAIVGGSPVIAMILPLGFLGMFCPEMSYQIAGHHLGVEQTIGVLAPAASILMLLTYIAGAVVSQHKMGSLLLSLLSPYYWVLACIAGWRALAQLARSPHQWDKTAHGAGTKRLVPDEPRPRPRHRR